MIAVLQSKTLQYIHMRLTGNHQVGIALKGTTLAAIGEKLVRQNTERAAFGTAGEKVGEKEEKGRTTGSLFIFSRTLQAT